MGAGHLISGRSRMRGNSLSYEIFRGVNYRGSFFFYEISLKVASSFRSYLPWIATFLPSYLSQSVGL